jgi:hypothetical protein
VKANRAKRALSERQRAAGAKIPAIEFALRFGEG